MHGPHHHQQDAKTEIANLQLQLASKTAEADSLKEELEQLQRDVAGEDDDQRHADTPGSLSKMQERLTRLRKEQADAEAERQAAWSELKKVVNDISSLASVDYLQSVRVEHAARPG